MKTIIIIKLCIVLVNMNIIFFLKKFIKILIFIFIYRKLYLELIITIYTMKMILKKILNQLHHLTKLQKLNINRYVK